MATHRFAIDVPNPSARATVVDLALERVTRTPQGTGLALPDGKLRVERAGMSLDPCGTARRRTLRVRLKPFSSATVTVVVVTASGAKGASTFQLVHRRGQRVVGGVTLACVAPPQGGLIAHIIPAPNPCPVALAGSPYPVAPDADPSKRPDQTNVTLGIACDLVAPLTNPTAAPLHGVHAYLEHLGGSDAGFTPTSWNIGTFAPGQVFYATWSIQPSGEKTGVFQASIVVASDNSDPTRLRAPVSLRRRG